MSFDFSPTFGNMYDIGSFDAKTYFAELLRKVQEGAVFNISKNGKQVAVLQGVKTAQNQEALEAHNRILSRSKRLAEQRKKEGVKPMTFGDIKELKNAGRKY
jgi:prevent-host-death family protein